MHVGFLNRESLSVLEIEGVARQVERRAVAVEARALVLRTARTGHPVHVEVVARLGKQRLARTPGADHEPGFVANDLHFARLTQALGEGT